MSEHTKHRSQRVLVPPDDLAALHRIYGGIEIDYVNVVRIAHVNRAFERWPLLAECRQLAEQKD